MRSICIFPLLIEDIRYTAADDYLKLVNLSSALLALVDLVERPDLADLTENTDF